MLQVKTEEQKNHILEILGEECNSYFPLNFKKETDVGYMEHIDRIYIDGNIRFDKMAEIVDYLRLVSKQRIEQ